jgi:SNF2 family DNA or RNA helicase
MHALMRGFADELVKLADLKTVLQPHQARVVEKIKREDQPGLVVAHGLGSGKTLTSIAAQEALGVPADIIVPAALQENYLKEVAKHVTGKTPARYLQSMQNLAVKGTRPDADMMIVDEAHRMRDPGSKTYKTISKNEAKKRLLLTASPFYNHPADIAPLINVAAGDRILPADPTEFELRHVRSKTVSPGFWGSLRGVKPGSVPTLNRASEKELRKVFGKWVDYYKSQERDYPSVKRETVRVDMTPEQVKIYDALIGNAPSWVAYKIKKGLPPSKAESQQLNAFLTAARQVSNSTAPYQTSGAVYDPKIQKAYENFKATLDKNPEAKAVIYSNYIDAGLAPYKKRLEAAGIPYGEFTGELSKAKRDELVRQYNENKIRALLVSSAGGEGLDLKGTRMIQVLDPHWNDEKIKQVEGRGIRYKSHAHLPEDQRNVVVQRYVATRPRIGLLEKMRLKKPGGAVDEYLMQRSAEKEALIDQFRKLLQTEEKKK